EGAPRASVPRPEAAPRGGPPRARTGRAPGGAREARGAREQVRRGGKALRRGEEGHRARGEEARARAGSLAGQGPLLPLRRGGAPDRGRDGLGVHPRSLAGDLRLQPRAGHRGDRPRRPRLPRVFPRGTGTGRTLTLRAPASPAPSFSRGEAAEGAVEAPLIS